MSKQNKSLICVNPLTLILISQSLTCKAFLVYGLHGVQCVGRTDFIASYNELGKSNTLYGGILISKRKKVDDLWLKALGEHIKQLILKKGFNSPYDFWVQSLGECVSRATLNYILNGEVDAKASTLKKIADALDVPIREVFNFKTK